VRLRVRVRVRVRVKVRVRVRVSGGEESEITPWSKRSSKD